MTYTKTARSRLDTCSKKVLAMLIRCMVFANNFATYGQIGSCLSNDRSTNIGQYCINAPKVNFGRANRLGKHMQCTVMQNEEPGCLRAQLVIHIMPLGYL